ncbi:replication factor A protein 1-like [Tetranychus urticae]|uniref:Replication protein A OB domain-containing protein n=1 Tax=Tetranychus urticae TaxID=32264 RepID=T1L6G2_TETUR|nr:replication factor A protein 1-like [Tetranychus urticae]
MGLTPGAIQLIISGRYVLSPCLQLSNLSSIDLGNSQSQVVTCCLSDGIQFYTPCILPVVPDVRLQENSVVILDDYSFHFSPGFDKFIIKVFGYKLIPDALENELVQGSHLPLVTPLLLDFSHRSDDLMDLSLNESSVDLGSGVELNDSSFEEQFPPERSPVVPQSPELPAITGSPLVGTLDLSQGTSGCATSSRISLPPVTYSTHFVQASSLLSKRNQAIPNKSLPIFSLSCQSQWTIQGRVTYKGALGDLKQTKGHWFFFELSDLSGTIKINAFQEECNRFFNIIKLGSVYSISNGELVAAKPPFNFTNHLREITLKYFSTVKEESDFNDAEYPNVPSNFTKISNLANLPPNSIVDVIGVCVFVTLIHQRTRRSILIQDDSFSEIRLSIWNLAPEDFNPPLGSILVVRRARLTQQQCGLILTISGPSSTICLSPSIPEATALMDWYKKLNSSVSFSSLSRGFFGEISHISSLPQSLQDDVIVYTNLEVLVISGDVFKYKAHTVCGRRVKIYQRDIPVCENCLDTLPNLSDQIVITLKISDSSGQAEVQAFTAVALELLSKSINDISSITESSLTLDLEDILNTTLRLCIKSRVTFLHDKKHLQHSIKFFSKDITPEI